MLLPCPFCGNEEPGVRIRTYTNPTTGNQVECIHCGIHTPNENYLTEAQAVEFWNTRLPVGS